MGDKNKISMYILQQSQQYFWVLASSTTLPCSLLPTLFNWTLADLNFEFFSLNDRKVLISRSKKSDSRWICLVSITTRQPHLSWIWSAGAVFPLFPVQLIPSPSSDQEWIIPCVCSISVLGSVGSRNWLLMAELCTATMRDYEILAVVVILMGSHPSQSKQMCEYCPGPGAQCHGHQP